MNSKAEAKVCCNCGTGSTPVWRKDRQDGQPRCSACYQYFDNHDAPRPARLWKEWKPRGGTAAPDGADGGGPKKPGAATEKKKRKYTKRSPYWNNKQRRER